MFKLYLSCTLWTAAHLLSLKWKSSLHIYLFVITNLLYHCEISISQISMYFFHVTYKLLSFLYPNKSLSCLTMSKSYTARVFYETGTVYHSRALMFSCVFFKYKIYGTDHLNQKMKQLLLLFFFYIALVYSTTPGF